MAVRRALATLSATKDTGGGEAILNRGPACKWQDGSGRPQQRRSLPVHITRREFAIGTGTLALTGAAVLAGFTTLGLSRPALAQECILMSAGPSCQLHHSVPW